MRNPDNARHSLTNRAYIRPMLFFGPRLNTVFASRWKALIWAGSILLTAYCAVPSAEETAAKRAEAAALAQTDQVKHHADNPWAIDPAKRPQ